MNAVLKGAMGGLLATVPMTLFMRAAHRRLPRSQKYPLPPEQITTKVSRTVGLEARPHERGWEWKTYAGHFSYGAVVGALYGALVSTSHRTSQEIVTRGCLFGVGVWTASYLGWLPALGILPPATREPKPRNLLMIIAHLIWGSFTALIVETRSEDDADTLLPSGIV